MILTLKDQEVLDENSDTLVNVNMIDNERYKRSVLNKTRKSTYDPNADDNYDEYGFPKNTILEKYDEEIDGEKKDNFVLGTKNIADSKRRQVEMVKQRLANKRLESLQMIEPKLASEYYTEEELAKFKKPKKKVVWNMCFKILVISVFKPEFCQLGQHYVCTYIFLITDSKNPEET